MERGVAGLLQRPFLFVKTLGSYSKGYKQESPLLVVTGCSTLSYCFDADYTVASSIRLLCDESTI
jgi:hypothetical protein